MKYEYKLELIGIVDFIRLKKLLNDEGQDGWEYCGVLNGYNVFKRQIIPSIPELDGFFKE